MRAIWIISSLAAPALAACGEEQTELQQVAKALGGEDTLGAVAVDFDRRAQTGSWDGTTVEVLPGTHPVWTETSQGDFGFWSDRVYLDMSLLTDHHAAAA
jgi:hypothetical protein